MRLDAWPDAVRPNWRCNARSACRTRWQGVSASAGARRPIAGAIADRISGSSAVNTGIALKTAGGGDCRSLARPAQAGPITRAAGRQSRLLQRKCAACGKAPHKAEECPACKRKRLSAAHRVAVAAEAGQVGFAGLPASISSRVDRRALAQPGRPLDAAVRGHMEQRFATSFGNVRIDDDAVSHGASRVLGAEAFAVGQHVHFASGRFRPASRDGLNLIAHELAHSPAAGHAVCQLGRCRLGAAGSPLERDADRAAERAVAGVAVDALQLRRVPSSSAGARPRSRRSTNSSATDCSTGPSPIPRPSRR